MKYLVFLKGGQVLDVSSGGHDILNFLAGKGIGDSIFLENNFFVKADEIQAIKKINHSAPKIFAEELERGGQISIDCGDEKMNMIFKTDEEIQRFLRNFSNESLEKAKNLIL